MSTLSVVLADDHHVVRHGLRVLLESELDCRVVGEAANGAEAAALVQQLQPDLLVVDMMMPGLTGLEVTTRVRERSPHTRVVIFSMHADESNVREALRAGATAYVLKESMSADFIFAVQQAVDGRRYLSPPLSERAIESYAHQAGEATLDLYETLTERVHDVLYLAAQGLTSTEIAERLVIGVRTIDTHRPSLMRKLGLRSPVELVRYALRRSIISLDP